MPNGSTTTFLSIFIGAARAFSTARNLSAYQRAANARERALLTPFPGAVRADVLDGTWSPPTTDGSGRGPRRPAQGARALPAAGYELKGTALRARAAAGRSFEIMVTSRDEERLALAFASNLAAPASRASAAGRRRAVRSAPDFAFDFDMIEYRWEQSLSPGNEQSFYWGSAAADEQGSRNYMGVRSAAVDAMIAAMLRARERRISSPPCARSTAC